MLFSVLCCDTQQIFFVVLQGNTQLSQLAIRNKLNLVLQTHCSDDIELILSRTLNMPWHVSSCDVQQFFSFPPGFANKFKSSIRNYLAMKLLFVDNFGDKDS